MEYLRSKKERDCAIAPAGCQRRNPHVDMWRTRAAAMRNADKHIGNPSFLSSPATRKIPPN
ncbi:hypothetical protein [Variovorax arabinosiphilus]|uniref:hypothetical protein n=1 Tax=Variovorax arabinosiphilus TaxID=3053498 RepID=UPI002574CF77|nr:MULTISPECIES: hypothetical protein [unclassified Variovorax]MDM0119072.1 hypothetical protein [Variovorax sp. J2L1-78]MDM0129498.1 hypothetical protein [Variovorax sp. J2L1-63]MDM0232716.1 hypothetical protein [Variovorax sp. J2R1-6]